MHQALNEEEGSRVLGISTQTMRNWRHVGKGPPYIKLGRIVRYKLQDLLDYMDQKKIIPENERENG